MEDLYCKIESDINNYSKVIFGPILVDEFTEMSLIAPIVNKFLTFNENRDIKVVVRESSKDLYTDCTNISTFSITSNYVIKNDGLFDTELNRCLNEDEIKGFYNRFLNSSDYKSDDIFICNYFNFKNYDSEAPTDLSELNYEVLAHEDNLTAIAHVLAMDKNVGKIPFVLSIDKDYIGNTPLRLWNDHTWAEFYKKLDDTNKYIVFVDDKNCPAMTPNSSTFVKLSSFVKLSAAAKEKNITRLGLLEEAIKCSIFTLCNSKEALFISSKNQTPTLLIPHNQLPNKQYNVFNEFVFMLEGVKGRFMTHTLISLFNHLSDCVCSGNYMELINDVTTKHSGFIEKYMYGDKCRAIEDANKQARPLHPSLVKNGRRPGVYRR